MAGGEMLLDAEGGWESGWWEGEGVGKMKVDDGKMVLHR
jgi:hypothetical protein